MIPTPEAFTEVESLAFDNNQVEIKGNDGQSVIVPLTTEKIWNEL